MGEFGAGHKQLGDGQLPPAEGWLVVQRQRAPKCPPVVFSLSACLADKFLLADKLAEHSACFAHPPPALGCQAEPS